MTKQLNKQLDQLTIGAAFVLASPALWLSFIPFTDLPQHVAVVSILQHLHHDAFRFSEFFTIAPFQTLYWLPYAIAVPLTFFMSSKAAYTVVTFLSLIAYPLGLRALLKAYQKPGFYALFGLPFVYSRASFWGFINFNFAIGFAFIAWALVVRKKNMSPLPLILASICGLFSHIYFVGIIGLLFLLHWIAFQKPASFKRLGYLSPAMGLSAVWLIVFGQATGDSRHQDISTYGKFLSIPMELNGGFTDTSDNWIGCITALLLLVTSIVSARHNRKNQGLRDHVFVLGGLFFLANIVLYFILPLHTSTAKFVNFRHLILAASILPLALPQSLATSLWIKGTSLIVASVTIVNLFAHMIAFDQEAAPFKHIQAQPASAGVVAGLIFEHHSVIRTSPYLHFHAYWQAKKGGMISSSFAKFWNIPVQLRTDTKIPRSFLELEWQPKNFDESKHPGLTDYVIARTNDGVVFPQTDYFPFTLLSSKGPWQLYKKAPTKAVSTEAPANSATPKAEKPDSSSANISGGQTVEENETRPHP